MASLKGGRSLTDAQAESLSKHAGRLDLSGVRRLSDSQAKSLSKHKGAKDGHPLSLTGLTWLSETAERALRRCRHIYFPEEVY
jgi:hypothetical protein